MSQLGINCPVCSGNPCQSYPPNEALTVTLRDQFAMAALTGLLADESGGEGAVYAPEWAAERAYKFADAMLDARKKASNEPV